MQNYDTPPLVISDSTENIADLLVNRAKSTPNDPLFAIETKPGIWLDVTAKEFENRVIALAKGLVASGIQPGQAVGIMSRTRFEWVLIDFAIWYAGAISVPIYESSAPSQIEWILSDSDCVGLFLENNEHQSRYEEIKRSAPLCRNIWNLEENAIEKLEKLGKDIPDDEIEARRQSAGLEDLATIIYTSGTTGKPKGCELLHRGFVELSKNATLKLPEVLDPNHTLLLFLPLAHVFARFISVLGVHSGVKIGHQPDAKNVAAAMQSFRPHLLLAVPRVFEKVYNSAEQKAEAGGKGKIFRKAAHIGIAYSKALDTREGPALGLKLKHKLFDKLVYKKLRAAMGGRVKYAISGGAPLGARLGHFYRAIGLIVLEGYGLTETTAPVSIGSPKNLRIGKVGIMLPGTGIKLAHDNEILLRGNNILRGYWRNPEATAAAFDGEWFKSGDIGEIDSDGFISITGRKKEIIVTSGGKNIAPALLEDPLRANPLISQVVLIGDQKPFVSALIFLDPEMLPIWLKNNGLSESIPLAEAAKESKVLAEIKTAVDRVNKNFSAAESIRNYTVIGYDLSEASGHLTPSLKIKREVVFRDFGPAIEDIYQSDPETSEIIS